MVSPSWQRMGLVALNHPPGHRCTDSVSQPDCVWHPWWWFVCACWLHLHIMFIHMHMQTDSELRDNRCLRNVSVPRRIWRTAWRQKENSRVTFKELSLQQDLQAWNRKSEDVSEWWVTMSAGVLFAADRNRLSLSSGDNERDSQNLSRSPDNISAWLECMYSFYVCIRYTICFSEFDDMKSHANDYQSHEKSTANNHSDLWSHASL